jgi:hypothetical protein
MRRTAGSAIDWEIHVLAVRTGFPKPERTARYSVFKDRSKPGRGLYRARLAQGNAGDKPLVSLPISSGRSNLRKRRPPVKGGPAAGRAAPGDRTWR